MPTKDARKAADLIARAFEASGMSQKSFGHWLEQIAFDFKTGQVCEPVKMDS